MLRLCRALAFKKSHTLTQLKRHVEHTCRSKAHKEIMTKVQPIRLGILTFPNITPIDLVGPYEVLARAPGCEVELVWKAIEEVKGDSGMTLLPTETFASAPQFDVILVPGGPGHVEMMKDDDVLSFLRKQSSGARWVTSVCTGSLILAAAGLLTGYKATSHWLSIEALELFGCTPISERVVVDGNRITGAGATSGLDFAFTLLAHLQGVRAAQMVQLWLEYDPAPPFSCGHPRLAPKELIDEITDAMVTKVAQRRLVYVQAAELLNPVIAI
jgi:cyclohexyl-isocyanide hydratase